MTSTTFTERLKTSPNLAYYRTIGYYLAFIALGVSNGVVGPTLRRLADQTGSTDSEISLILTARGIGYMFSSYIAGRLYDRFPGHWLISSFLILVGLFAIVSPAIPVLALLAPWFFLWGMSDSGLDLGGNNLLLWTHGDKSAPFMNGLHFFFGVGSFIAPVIVAQSITLTDGIELAYAAVLISVLPAALLLFRLPSPVRDTSKDDANTQSTNLLIAALLATFFFLYVAMEVGYGNWLATYATKLDLMNEKDASYLTSVFWGSLTIGRLIGIPLATRFMPKTILLVDLFGSLIGIIGIVLSPDVTVLWVCTFIMGFSQASVFPTTLAFAEKRMTITAQASSWFFIGAGLGGILTPPIIGILMDKIEPAAMMWAIAIDTVLAIGLFLYMLRRFPDKPETLHQNDVDVQEPAVM